MLFDVERTTVSGRPALVVRGELDIATAPVLAAAGAAELAGRPAALVVDLSATTFLDSSGARQLVRLGRQGQADGVTVQLLCPRDNGPVRLVLDLLDVDSVVPVVESLPPGRRHGDPS
ncbi:STAS domain-containing protein [Geodermatophilus sp. YIM 151500]|uniref:STAS domain-containing protein n=1 Tax=Geodermatophilus sp. YIM 151500 TaxID=2984531 RepID=UPI0021E3DA3F|nr:STAS domain-containing protein [Geodermatophilus sp. YIM 151500]MCV2488202.1 STAS domain-containing protein [Geodermatophilus sp. YIM 151500]